MRDRVRPPRDLEWVLDRLKDDGFFETKQKAIMFAASLGYSLRRASGNRGLPLETYGEGIRMEYFERQLDDRFVELMAVADRGALEVLSEEKRGEAVESFEGYAHAGLVEIRDQCFADGKDPMIGLLRIIDRARRPASDSLPGLDPDKERVTDLL